MSDASGWPDEQRPGVPEAPDVVVRLREMARGRCEGSVWGAGTCAVAADTIERLRATQEARVAAARLAEREAAAKIGTERAITHERHHKESKLQTSAARHAEAQRYSAAILAQPAPSGADALAARLAEAEARGRRAGIEAVIAYEQCGCEEREAVEAALDAGKPAAMVYVNICPSVGGCSCVKARQWRALTEPQA